MTSAGPFASAREARAAAHVIIAPGPDLSVLDEEQCEALLERVCEMAGVELGTYDRRVLRWAAGYEDSLCGAIAGVILRAYAAGQRSATIKEES